MAQGLFFGGSEHRAVAHTRPAFPKMLTAPSAFPLLGAPQAPGDDPLPHEVGKSLGLLIYCLYFFLFGSIINESVNFLFLPDRRLSGVGWGGSKSNMSKMVSIGSSSVCGTSLESFKRCFCYWFWCLLWVYLGPSTMYTISPILLFNYSTFPTGSVILIFFKINFFSRVEPFFRRYWGLS